MFLRMFSASALISHALLGSLCMMPTAMAMPMLPETHAEHEELNMTSMYGMSLCDFCAQQFKKAAPAGCDGHCLESAGVAMSTTGGSNTLAASISDRPGLENRMPEAGLLVHEYSGPPGGIRIAAIVLRQ